MQKDIETKKCNHIISRVVIFFVVIGVTKRKKDQRIKIKLNDNDATVFFIFRGN